jgi:predicted dehydrogenase
MVVLIIGFGSIAKKHYEVLRKINPAIVVYALRSAKGAESISGITNIYSLQELTVQPDFIIISSPTLNHYQDILNCLKFRCPLFIEKPVLASLEKSENLKDELMKSGVITYVACVLRFHPCLDYIKQTIMKKEQVNEVNIYCGSYLPDWRPGKNFKELYSANKDQGGGVHLDLIHELDYSYWLFGKPEYWHSYSSSKSTLSINAEDSASYLLSYEKFNVNIVLNYFRKSPKRTLEIVSENYTWIADLINYKISDDTGKEVFVASGITIMDLYEKQMRYFIDHVKSGIRCENDFQTGLTILEICLLNNYAKK